MDAGDGLAVGLDRPAMEWFRLTTEPVTAPAIAAQLGLGEDPLDALPARGIAYDHLVGNETGPLEEYLPSMAPDRAAVIRISLLDRGAHRSTLRLYEMPAALMRLLNAIVPRLLTECLRQRRPLVLTTDHGLSLSPSGLTHGRSGVFEQTIFRAWWSFEEGSPD